MSIFSSVHLINMNISSTDILSTDILSRGYFHAAPNMIQFILQKFYFFQLLCFEMRQPINFIYLFIYLF